MNGYDHFLSCIWCFQFQLGCEYMRITRRLSSGRLRAQRRSWCLWGRRGWFCFVCHRILGRHLGIGMLGSRSLGWVGSFGFELWRRTSRSTCDASRLSRGSRGCSHRKHKEKKMSQACARKPSLQPNIVPHSIQQSQKTADLKHLAVHNCSNTFHFEPVHR